MISYKNLNLNLINKDFEYLNWLYTKNPMGNYIGIDAFDNNKLVGQHGGYSN